MSVSIREDEEGTNKSKERKGLFQTLGRMQ